MDQKMGEVRRFPVRGRSDDFLERLCRSHEPQLIAYLTQMLGRADIAREVAQDTYERLHRVRPDEVLFPRALLFKVATNFALMHLRRRQLESTLISGPAGMEEVMDEGAGPDRRALGEQIGRHILNVIQSLRPGLRAVFIMAHVEGKPRREIAEALGISEKRLDKRMTEALRLCRERLSAQGIDLAGVD